MKCKIFSKETDLGEERCCRCRQKGSGSQTQKNRSVCQTIEDCAKDGGEEFFTEMHCIRITNL